MRLRTVILVTLAIATATTSISAQTFEGALAPKPVAESKPALDLKYRNQPATNDGPALPRAAVTLESQPQQKKSSVWPTVVGAVVGGAVGFVGALSIAADDTPCQPNCRKGAFVYPLLIGGPFVGGAIGRWIGNHR